MKMTAKQVKAKLAKMQEFETKQFKAYYSTNGYYTIKVGEVVIFKVNASTKVIRTGIYPKEAHYNMVANMVKRALVTNLFGYKHAYV